MKAASEAAATITNGRYTFLKGIIKVSEGTVELEGEKDLSRYHQSVSIVYLEEGKSFEMV